MLEQKSSTNKYREQISDFLDYTLLKKAYYHTIILGLLCTKLFTRVFACT